MSRAMHLLEEERGLITGLTEVGGKISEIAARLNRQ